MKWFVSIIFTVENFMKNAGSFKICYEDNNKLELTKLILISEYEKKLAISKKHNKQIQWINHWR